LLTTEQTEALAARLKGFLSLELPGEEFAYVLIFVERERFQKDKEPTPVVVANLGEKLTVHLIKLTANSL
jgi:hypothetical protein